MANVNDFPEPRPPYAHLKRTSPRAGENTVCNFWGTLTF